MNLLMQGFGTVTNWIYSLIFVLALYFFMDCCNNQMLVHLKILLDNLSMLGVLDNNVVLYDLVIWSNILHGA
jgi:hypothetical protein